MGLYLGGLIIGRIFASEIGGGGGGGELIIGILRYYINKFQFHYKLQKQFFPLEKRTHLKTLHAIIFIA